MPVGRPIAIAAPCSVHDRNVPAVAVVGIEGVGQAHCLDVVGANDSLALLPDSLQSRHQNSHQQRNNGDDNEKLDEREASSNSHFNMPL